MKLKIKSIEVGLPVLDAIIVSLGTVFLTVAVQVRDIAIQAVLAGISASFFFFEFTRVVESLRQALPLRRFRKFFSSAAVSESFCFVYPEFVLSQEAVAILDQKHFHKQGIYTKSRVLFERTHRVDIPECVAINDIEALIEFVGLFGQMIGRTPSIRSDSDTVEEGGYSFVSFGFSSNDCTHMYLDRLKSPLFRLVDDESSDRYAEFIEVRLPNDAGTLEWIPFKSDNREEIGIFLKQHPDPKTDPDKVWMFCAGLGPQATVGTARFIRRNWQTLYKTVGDRDFIAVIAVARYSQNEHRLLALRPSDQ